MILVYIDPGLGQMIWLSIVSAVTGFIFYIKKTRAIVVSIFLKIFGRPRRNPPATKIVSVNEVESKNKTP